MESQQQIKTLIIRQVAEESCVLFVSSMRLLLSIYYSNTSLTVTDS